MTKEELQALQHKVTMLRAEGKYKETIEESHRLLELGMEHQDYKSIFTAHINNAASYYCIGDIEEAFKSIEAYDETCAEHGDDADYLNLYNVLFLLYDYNKDFQNAKETLTKSIALGKRLEKYNIISNGYSNYSHVCLVEKDFEKALEMGQLGLEMAEKHQPDSPILRLRVKLNIAQAYIGLRDFEAAGSLIDEMIHDPLLDSFIREKSQCHILLGSWYMEQELYREAFDSLTLAKELVDSYQDVYLLKVIQEDRCKLCDLMRDIEKGYVTQREYIALLNEISKRELELNAQKLAVKHSLKEIEKKANTDFLTGLSNRKFLEMRTDEWLKQAAESGESIACVVFDIDDFKRINDENGHLFGDEVIKQVSKTCAGLTGENEMIGRYGGDEFVFILKEASLEAGREKAVQIIEAFSGFDIQNAGKQIELRTSIGVSDNASGAILSFNELFHLADMALYQAKHNGKNQVCISK